MACLSVSSPASLEICNSRNRRRRRRRKLFLDCILSRLGLSVHCKRIPQLSRFLAWSVLYLVMISAIRCCRRMFCQPIFATRLEMPKRARRTLLVCACLSVVCPSLNHRCGAPPWPLLPDPNQMRWRWRGQTTIMMSMMTTVHQEQRLLDPSTDNYSRNRYNLLAMAKKTQHSHRDKQGT